METNVVENIQDSIEEAAKGMEGVTVVTSAPEVGNCRMKKAVISGAIAGILAGAAYLTAKFIKRKKAAKAADDIEIEDLDAEPDFTDDLDEEETELVSKKNP